MIQAHQVDDRPDVWPDNESSDRPRDRHGRPGSKGDSVVGPGLGRLSTLALAVSLAGGLVGCEPGASSAVDVQGEGLAVRMEVVPPAGGTRALPPEELELRVTLAGEVQPTSASGGSFVSSFELPGTGQYDLLIEWLSTGVSDARNDGVHLAVAGPLTIDAGVRRDITLTQDDYRRRSADIDTAAGRNLDIDADGIGNLDELRLGRDLRTGDAVTPNANQTNCAELNGAPPGLPAYFDASARFNNSGQDGYFVMAGRLGGLVTPTRFSSDIGAAFVPLWVVEAGSLSLVHSQGGPDDTGAILYQTRADGAIDSRDDFDHADARRASVSVDTINPGVYCYRLEGRGGAVMTGSMVQIAFTAADP